jgi:hypothetical protein
MDARVASELLLQIAWLSWSDILLVVLVFFITGTKGTIEKHNTTSIWAPVLEAIVTLVSCRLSIVSRTS